MRKATTSATTKSTKPAKKVQIISRHDHSNGFVHYVVRSSDGQHTYATTLRNGKPTHCTCPATKPCYHMEQLKKAEKKLQRELKESPLVPIYAAKFAGKTVGVVNGRLQVVPTDDKKVSAECPVVVHNEILTKAPVYPTQAQRNNAPLGGNERRDFSKMVLLNK